MGNIDLGFFHLGVFIFIQCQRCLEPLRLFACVQHRVTSQNWMTRVHRLFMRRLFICAFMISPYTCVYFSSVFSSVYYQAPFHPCDYEAPFHNRADVCIIGLSVGWWSTPCLVCQLPICPTVRHYVQITKETATLIVWLYWDGGCLESMARYFWPIYLSLHLSQTVANLRLLPR